MEKYIIGIGAVVAIAVTTVLLINGAKVPETQQVEASLPQPSGYVVDEAGVLSPEVEAQIVAGLESFDTTAQIAVLTVRTTGRDSIDQYGIKIGDAWAVGHEDTDDGVILIVAVDDRKVRIEVGRGAEGNITDSEAGEILDGAVIPHFKEGNWEAGIVAGVEGIKSEFTN